MTRALCALLILFGMSLPASGDDASAPTAILIAARSDLRDPNFKDAVVLVMNNIGPAPAGVIINRPTKITVANLFPEIEPLAELDDKVYFGGPVEIASVSFLFRGKTPQEDAIQVLDGVYASTDKDLLLKLLTREKPMEGLRIYIGHTGWGPGQLENEVGRGDWKLMPAGADAIFNGKSEHPWPEPAASPDEGQRS